MRILLLSWNYPPVLGGIEYVVENLFLGLRRRSHQVALVAACAENVPADPDIHRAPKKGLRHFAQYAFTQGYRLCRSLRPETILCGSLTSAPAAYLLSRLFHLPYTILIHGSDILHPGWLYQRIIRFLLKRATRLAANSTQTKRLLEEMGIPAQRIDVIHPGVRPSPSADSPLNQDLLSLCQNRRVLLSVGRLIRRKGLLEFVEQVMPTLAQEHPDILFLIVGDDAKVSLVHPERLRDRIQAKVAELHLENHVKLLGTVPDAELNTLFHQANLFVLPALDIPGDIEGFGIVLLEAALAGAPAVATRVGGIPEAVQDNITGLLVPPADYPALGQAITRLLSDHALHQTLATAAAHRARTDFSWDVILQQYESSLRKCLS